MLPSGRRQPALMMHRSKLPYFFLALSAVLAIAAVVIMVVKTGGFERFRRLASPPAPPAVPAKPVVPDKPEPPPPVPGLQDPMPPEDPAKALADLGVKTGVAEADPQALVNNIAKALESGDFDAFARLVGKDACPDQTLSQLKELSKAHPLKVRQPDGVREIGELELDTRTRWSLDLEGAEPGHDRIYLDLLKKDGKWSVEKLTLPPPPGEPVPRAILADSLGVAGGDIHYSPLVKNPQGGETLALYFGFDEDGMNPRTRRQLEIVAHVLRADPGKKITLSGHTDALGTAEYNNSLSARRAATVRDFLISAGVSSTQIVTVAKGASQPRRPNVTETGEDDPRGRRANRRTEIYLDF